MTVTNIIIRKECVFHCTPSIFKIQNKSKGKEKDGLHQNGVITDIMNNVNLQNKRVLVLIMQPEINQLV